MTPGQEVCRAVDNEQPGQKSSGHEGDGPPVGGYDALDQGYTGEDNCEETGRFQPEEERFGEGRGVLISDGRPGRPTRAKEAQV